MLRSLLLVLLLAAPLCAEKKVINPDEFRPAAGAPAPMFNAGILVDGTLYAAGQIGVDLKTGAVPDSFEDEVKLCLHRIELVLRDAQMTFGDVVSVQVYLTDTDLFARMNAVYGKVFTTELGNARPARTTVGVTKLALPKARIEITVTARK